MKKYHEWGYQFNESGTIEGLTTRQKQMIQLAERAEAYVQRQQSKQNQPGSTRSGLENRQSKRERIEAAKRKHATSGG